MRTAPIRPNPDMASCCKPKFRCSTPRNHRQSGIFGSWTDSHLRKFSCIPPNFPTRTTLGMGPYRILWIPYHFLQRRARRFLNIFVSGTVDLWSTWLDKRTNRSIPTMLDKPQGCRSALQSHSLRICTTGCSISRQHNKLCQRCIDVFDFVFHRHKLRCRRT